VPEGLILEFDGVGREEYDAVDERLGINQYSRVSGPLGSYSMPGRRSRAAGWSLKSGSPRLRRSGL
jgi:hypothetical protein